MTCARRCHKRFHLQSRLYRSAVDLHLMGTADVASIAAGVKAASLRHPEGQTLRLWSGLISGQLSFQEVLEHMRSHPQLSYLTIDTTGVCDLRCPGMCYYHPDIDVRRPPVPVDALKAAIADAHTVLGLRSVVFAGKEPLQNTPRLVELARHTANLQGHRPSIGVVTNGRGISKHQATLDGLVNEGALSFMDISIDSGNADEHDTIRGTRGTHALAMAALEQCTKAWPSVRVGASSVLRHDNAHGILDLLRSTAAFNRHFFITPIQPPPFTSTAPLPWRVVGDFLARLTELLQGEVNDAGIEVMVSLLGLHLTEAVAEGFLVWEELTEDDAGQCYVERNLGTNKLLVHVQVLPETGWRIGRITYTGTYLPNTHFLQAPDPDHLAVGYVQQERITELYRRALADEGVLAQVLRSRERHECQGRPCWAHCFGGLVGAENSYVGGAALDKQPFLCLKTEKDFQPHHANTH